MVIGVLAGWLRMKFAVNVYPGGGVLVVLTAVTTTVSWLTPVSTTSVDPTWMVQLIGTQGAARTCRSLEHPAAYGRVGLHRHGLRHWLVRIRWVDCLRHLRHVRPGGDCQVRPIDDEEHLVPDVLLRGQPDLRPELDGKRVGRIISDPKEPDCHPHSENVAARRQVVVDLRKDLCLQVRVVYRDAVRVRVWNVEQSAPRVPGPRAGFDRSNVSSIPAPVAGNC